MGFWPFSLELPTNPRANLVDLPRYVGPSTAGAALVAALIAFTGPVVLVLQAGTSAQLSPEQINSWVFAVAVGGGMASLVLSLLYRQPLCNAWSIAGAALLVGTLPRFPFAEAVGAYLVSGLLILLLAVSGLFGAAMERVPPEIVMGMLAGILLRFAIGIFTPIVGEPILVLAMLAAFLLFQKLRWQTPTLAALVVGTVVAAMSGRFALAEVSPRVTIPELYVPTFSLEATLSLALPLTILALTSQNAPGIGILWAQGYSAPANAITFVSGIASLVTAPLGGHGVNLAAPMTAICSAPTAHADPAGRYAAAVINGLLLITFGVAGATATAIMLALPAAVIGVAAGLAMIPALLQALRAALAQDRRAYGAFFALVIAASDVNLLGVGAPFWSLVGGLVISRLID